MPDSSRPSVALLLLLSVAACSDGGTDETTDPTCVPRTTTRGLPGTPGTGTGTPTVERLTSVSAFGENPGGLAMFVHAPASLAAGAPVVVALHGCTQTASAYASAGWNELADRAGFVVVYPEQSSVNDPQRCFRWWDPAHTTRDRGEAKSIRSMVDAVRAKYGVQDAFVTGLSAGAAMTAVMLATYPDVFGAGAIMSGLPYHCATTKNDAYACMSGKNESASQWSALLPPQALSHPPRVAVWQGSADYIVRPSNATALVRQWTSAHHLPETPSATEHVGPAEHTVYRDGSGVAAVESWSVEAMSHGVALDPKHGCGTAGAYLLDVGLCSTQKAAEFFGIVPSTAPGTTGASGDGGAARPGASPGTSTAPNCK